MENYLTLVVHTRKRAERLKEILESHDVDVALADMNLPDSPELEVVSVCIPAGNLPVALKLMESVENNSSAGIEMKMAGMSGTLLIPVDFSDSSILAVKVGFSLAYKIGIRPIILHTYLSPLFTPADQMDPAAGLAPDGTAIIEDRDMFKIESRQLEQFKSKVREMQEAGELPDLRFSTLLLEGVPEEVITDYCKEHLPMMVVMATRGVNRKEEDLVGSVTAEVLDSCRVPVFAVPENYKMPRVEDIRKLVMLCTLERHDISAVRALMQTFNYPTCEFWLVPVQEKTFSNNAGKKLSELRNFFTHNYPMSEFHRHPIEDKDFSEGLDKFIREHDIQLLIVPNRKTNVFSRIFRPSIAHKCLFRRDMPLLALPV